MMRNGKIGLSLEREESMEREEKAYSVLQAKGDIFSLASFMFSCIL